MLYSEPETPHDPRAAHPHARIVTRAETSALMHRRGDVLHYVDRELHAAVSARSDGRAYRVERAGRDVHETALGVRPITGT